jgi:UDP-glucose 4-epimerase
MKVGITGVAGMLGSHLSEILINDGHSVVGVDDLSYGTKDNLSIVLDNERFKFLKFDARDRVFLSSAFIDCDFIVHLAAVKKIVESQVSYETLDVNVVTTKNVLDIARSTGAKVVFASTSDIYGVSEEVPFREDQNLVIGQSLAKRWSYAVSKMYAEHLCVGYNKDFGVDVVMLRYFGGFSEKSAFLWSGGHVPIFINQILNDQEVTIHGDGQQTRSMGHASDLAFGTYLAMQQINHCSGEIINIGNHEEISVLDTAYMIADELNVERNQLKIKFIPESEIYGVYRDLRRRRPDLTKAERLLGYRPKLPLNDAIKLVCSAMKQRQNTNV